MMEVVLEHVIKQLYSYTIYIYSTNRNERVGSQFWPHKPSPIPTAHSVNYSIGVRR